MELLLSHKQKDHYSVFPLKFCTRKKLGYAGQILTGTVRALWTHKNRYFRQLG